MTRFVRPVHHVLIALALLFSQQAAQLHAMGHVGSELAAAAQGEQSDKSAPPAGHPAEHCLAFHAIDSALAAITPAVAVQCAGVTPVAFFTLPLAFASRIIFDSRAPPALS